MPSPRPVVSFTVSLHIEKDGALVQRWMDADGKLGDKAGAVEFRAHPSPTIGELHRVDSLVHDYAGGLRPYLDLVDGAERARSVVLRRLEADLWPGGRPEAKGTALHEQERRIGEAWLADQSIDRQGYETMKGMLDRLRFLASWVVLVVDPPAGWEKLADRVLPMDLLVAIWGAFNEAARATAEGKEQPAGS